MGWRGTGLRGQLSQPRWGPDAVKSAISLGQRLVRPRMARDGVPRGTRSLGGGIAPRSSSAKLPHWRDRCLENRSPPLGRMRHEAARVRVFRNGAQWHGGCYHAGVATPKSEGTGSWPSIPSCFTSSSRSASWLWPPTAPAASDPRSGALPSLVPAHRPSGDSPHLPQPTPAKRPVGRSDGARPPWDGSDPGPRPIRYARANVLHAGLTTPATQETPPAAREVEHAILRRGRSGYRKNQRRAAVRRSPDRRRGRRRLLQPTGRRAGRTESAERGLRPGAGPAANDPRHRRGRSRDAGSDRTVPAHPAGRWRRPDRSRGRHPRTVERGRGGTAAPRGLGATLVSAVADRRHARCDAPRARLGVRRPSAPRGPGRFACLRVLVAPTGDEIAHYALEFPAPDGAPHERGARNYCELMPAEALCNASSYAAFAVHAATGGDQRFGARDTHL
jgi:hypothetical protein